jgi:hypothetical protein
MLTLEDPYWQDLHTPFGDARRVPTLLRTWHSSIGSDGEAAAYAELFEHYLHQLTISSCSYAVVPHLVSHLDRCALPRRIEVLGHVATVEMQRPLSDGDIERDLDQIRAAEGLSEEMRDPLLAASTERSPLLPDRLQMSYLAAIEDTRRMATELLRSGCAPSDFARLLGALTGLFAPGEFVLARALMQPDGLWIEAEYEGQASIGSLLSDRRAGTEEEA